MGQQVKLFLAVAVLLVSPSLQAPTSGGQSGGDGDLKDLIMHYLNQQGQQQGKPEQYNQGMGQGQGMTGQPELYSDEVMKGLVKQYVQGMQGQGMDSGMGDGNKDNIMKMMLSHYLMSQKANMGNTQQGNMQQGTMQQGNMQQGKDYMLRALLGQFMSGADGSKDTVKSMISMLAQQQAKPSESKQMLQKLMVHAMASPKDGLVQKLLTHAISQQDGEDQDILAVLLTNMLSEKTGDERELVKSLLHSVMTNDNFKQGHNKQLILMLLRHYMNKDGGDDKEAIGLYLMYWLKDSQDPDSDALLRKLVFHMMTTTGQRKAPEDTPEEYQWKWLPPGPCRMTNNDNQVVFQESCPNNLQCSVGPFSVTVNNTQRRISLCAMPSEFMLYHACQVSRTDGTVLKYQDCPANYGQCNLGPFRVQVNDTEGTATFCSGTVQNFGRSKSIIDRACRVEDKHNYYPLQRRCPKGYSCGAGPFEADWSNGEMVHAYVCKENEEEEEKKGNKFMSKILRTMLGLNEDMGDMGQGMGQGKGNMTSDMGGNEFLKLILQHLMEQAKSQKKGVQGQMGKPMNQRDQIGLMILKHFVIKMKEAKMDASLVENVVKHMWYKAQKGGIEEGDRKVMNMLIMHFVQKKKAAAAKEEKENKQEDIMKMLMKFMMEQAKESQSGPSMDLMKMLLAHTLGEKGDMGDKMGDKGNMGEKDMLAMLVKHVLSEKKQQSESDSSGYKQLVMMLLKHAMEKKESKASEEEKQKALFMSLLKHVMMQKKEASQDGQHKEALMKMLSHLMMQRKESSEEEDPLAALYKLMSKRKGGEEDESDDSGKMMLKLLMHALQEKVDMHEDHHMQIESKLGMLKDKMRSREEGDGEMFKGLLKMLMKMKSQD